MSLNEPKGYGGSAAWDKLARMCRNIFGERTTQVPAGFPTLTGFDPLDGCYPLVHRTYRSLSKRL
jgi:hypothetical protein